MSSFSIGVRKKKGVDLAVLLNIKRPDTTIARLLILHFSARLRYRSLRLILPDLPLPDGTLKLTAFREWLLRSKPSLGE